MAPMSGSTPVVAELVPIADRVRWMLGCRALLVVVLFVVWLAVNGPAGAVPPVVWMGMVWVGVSGLMSITVMRPARTDGRGRWLAVLGFTLGLLGDGLLLAAACYSFGGLNGPIGYLIVLHGVAVTLLASFRTGAKLALWHSLLALLVVEAASSGVLDDNGGTIVSQPRMALYFVILWASVLATASFAAINERELRRRRYDSEVLRQFGVALADAQETAEISRSLARFARDELLASRALVVVQPCDDSGVVAGHAVLEGSPALVKVPGDAVEQGVLRTALGDRRTHLVARLDPERDRWLAEMLPDAHNLVVVPFALDQVVGAVVVEHPRRSSQRRSQRAERRTVSTTEQATAHASMAIGRAILLERIRAAADLDGLTQVANRRRFDAYLARTIADGGPFGLIMIDLDHFKRLNDQHGHQAGDEVLRAAARCIATGVGERGLAARYGGEEFAVVLPGADRAAAVEVAEVIVRAVREADTPVPVTASLGVAVHPEHTANGTEVLSAADAALYAAKAAGRNRVEVGALLRRAPLSPSAR
jgi:diguanylate cyclase (GGDEF)-like protein